VVVLGLTTRSAAAAREVWSPPVTALERSLSKTITLIAREIALATIFSVLLLTPSRAQETKISDLVISQPWSRATPNGATVASGYLTIENKGSGPDRLVGASADVAAKVELHTMAMSNGVMTMRPLESGLAIRPGEIVKLAPGGHHLMLLGLKSSFKQGDKVPITLEFEKAGKVKVALDLQGVGARSPDLPARPSPSQVVTQADQADNDNFFTHLHTEKAMANVTVSPGRSGPLAVTIQLETTDERALTAMAVLVTLTNPQKGEPPIAATAQHTSDDQWRATMSVPSGGLWQLRLNIKLSEADLVDVESPILLR
jgi:periplasmic copper chaperone A